ncbi:hypothetical protein CR513_37101, partial [Mucuna pruriens]
MYDCIGRLVPQSDVQQKIQIELQLYKNTSGLFGNKKKRLEHKRFHDLVFVKYNQQKYNARDEIIVINAGWQKVKILPYKHTNVGLPSHIAHGGWRKNPPPHSAI